MEKRVYMSENGLEGLETVTFHLLLVCGEAVFLKRAVMTILFEIT